MTATGTRETTNFAGATQRSTTAGNLLALLVFALTFSWQGWRREPAAPDGAPTLAVSRKELPNFHYVHSYLYRGGAPSYAGLDELKRLGVKTIIDLRTTPITIRAEHDYVTKMGIKHISIPMGNMSIPSLEKQQQVLEHLSAAASNPEKAPLFLHCAHGSDRTGFMIALWRVQHDRWSVAEAMSEMLRDGFLIHKLDPRGHVR